MNTIIDFQKIKEDMNLFDVARLYGVKSDKKGFALCPFHKEKTPSLRIQKEFFYCFGCNANGDVFDFTGMLFKLNLLETVRKLNRDFNLGISDEYTPEMREQIYEEVMLRKSERKLEESRRQEAMWVAKKYEDEVRNLRSFVVQTNDPSKIRKALMRVNVLNEELDRVYDFDYEHIMYFNGKDRYSGGNYLQDIVLGGGRR